MTSRNPLPPLIARYLWLIAQAIVPWVLIGHALGYSEHGILQLIVFSWIANECLSQAKRKVHASPQ